MTHRREFLTTVAGLSAVAAGCLGGGDDGPDLPDHATADDGDDSETADEPVVPNTERYDFPPPDEPGEAPDDMLCPACNHTPANWPESNGQVVHEDDHRQFVCSPGCLVAYREAPDQYAATDAPILTEWVRDIETRELHRIDRETLYWVLDTSPDDWRGIDPMSNPLPFVDREDAVAYIEEWDDLTVEEHLVGTDELDREIARKYRAVE